MLVTPHRCVAAGSNSSWIYVGFCVYLFTVIDLRTQGNLTRKVVEFGNDPLVTSMTNKFTSVTVDF